MRLQDKVAIVTGSSQGIGRPCVVAMAHEGAAVVINGTRADTAQVVVDEIRAAGGAQPPARASSVPRNRLTCWWIPRSANSADCTSS